TPLAPWLALQTPTRLLVREGNTPFDVKSVPVCLFHSSFSKPLLLTSPPVIIGYFLLVGLM
ncbi:MAG: hypothetical protein WB685_17520, partial [Pseudolabrys sp.]